MPPRSRAAKQTVRKKRRADDATKRALKPSITIIGAGHLGTALALALEQSGYQIDALVSRTRAHSRRAARLLHTRPLALAADELDELPASPLIIIATPDDHIAATAARLAATLEESKCKRIALHVSGALSSRELAPLAAWGFATGSLHPLVSVSDPASNAKDFAGAYYCVEGDASALRAARSLVKSLKGHAFKIAARDKALYHAAAVISSGHLVALFDFATELLTRCALTPTEARRVLLPLARGTILNLAQARENRAALTGPFARADVATIRRHLDALAALADAHDGHGDARDALEAYALLGLRSLRLATKGKTDQSRLAEIERTLARVTKRQT